MGLSETLLRPSKNPLIVILRETKNLNVTLRFFVAPRLRMTLIEVLLDGLSIPQPEDAHSCISE